MFNVTAKRAIDNGYSVKVLNLSNMNMSSAYNPLNNILDAFRALTADFDGYLYSEVKLVAKDIKTKGLRILIGRSLGNT